MKRFILSVWLIFLCSAGNGMEKERGSTIIVTAFPLEGPAVGRAADYLECGSGEAGSISGILESRSLVSVSERGGGDVQADLTLRGSTFQQVLLTLDGLPVMDPQTAHHNMDIPFPASALSGITVIPGPGTALLGPSAFAGSVDLALRQPSTNACMLRAGGGYFDTWTSEISHDRVYDWGSMNVGLRRSESDGFMPGADYDIRAGWGSFFVDSRGMHLRVSAGRIEKDFGAQDFYAVFPSREITSATFLDIAPTVELFDDWVLKLNARYRNHEDEFILFRDEPDRYRNLHESDSYHYRGRLISPESERGRMAVGLEHYSGELESSALGDRVTRTSSAFAAYRVKAGIVTIDAGLRGDDNSDWGSEVSPSLGLDIELVKGIRFFGSAARAVRPPSFTELYYTDPRNEGNDQLVPEEAWGYEAGLDFALGRQGSISLAFFQRDTKNLIDWTRTASDQPWRAVNQGEAVFDGVELKASYAAGMYSGNVFMQIMDVEADSGGYESKYAMNVPDYDLGCYGRIAPVTGTELTASVRYRHVPALDNYTLVSLGVSKKLGVSRLYVRADNLLDEDYQEIPGVPTAGTYLEAGFEIVW